MDFFKLAKGTSAIVRVLHSNANTIPTIKVHTVPTRAKTGAMIGTVVKCNNKDGHQCPLCAVYPKEEYQRVLYLYDYTDGLTKCFKTSSRKLVEALTSAQRDWQQPLNNLVFRLERASDEYGSYGITVVPGTQYPMPTTLESPIDTDVSYRFGMYRSDEEMQEYLKTGVMPPHKKAENNIYTQPYAPQPTAPTTPTPAPQTTPQVATPTQPVAPFQQVTAPWQAPNVTPTYQPNYQPVQTTVTVATPQPPQNNFTFDNNDDFVMPF